MELTLQRTNYDAVSTEGSISVNGVFQCYTLELPFTDGLPGSAIPEGHYRIVFEPSPKFESSADPWVKQYAAAMPHLVDVPKRLYIMIHWGNAAKDTDGCILIGQSKGSDFIGSSRAAFSALYELLRQSISRGDDVWITVSRGKGLEAETVQA